MDTFKEASAQYMVERGKPMPSYNHSITQSALTVAIVTRYREKYSIANELSLELPSRSATPDISIYLKRPMNPAKDQIKMTEPPLVIIEILSPSQSDYDIIQKFSDYFKDGVKSCWFVQPSLGIISIFTPDMKPHIFSSGEVKDPNIDIAIPLAEIF